MEAVKRLYDKSYDEHLETAASAKTYLAMQKSSDDNEKVKIRETRKEESGFIVNLVSVVSSIVYCVIILGILLIPLIAETKVHKMKVGFSSIKTEIRNLEAELSKVEAALDDKIVLVNIEKIAKEKLGLQNPSDTQTTYINSNTYFTIDGTDEIIENIDVANN